MRAGWVGGASIVALFAAGAFVGPIFNARPAASKSGPAAGQVVESATSPETKPAETECYGSSFDPWSLTREHAGHDGRGQVDFLVALVPDAFDSNARWLFDPMLEAIQSGITASGYVPDRFCIPDSPTPWGASTSGEPGPNAAHERIPGVILFRSAAQESGVRSPESGVDTGHRTPDAGPRSRLLMVLLVPETAFGVSQEPLRRALAVVADHGPDPAGEIRILGPNFSGSVGSLQAVLEAFQADHTSAHFRIVSGGATARSNKQTLESTLGPLTTFHATVVPDQYVVQAVVSRLLQMNPSLRGGSQVAFLVEENTGWGSSLFDVLKTLSVPNALVVPFPLHVSRVRNAAAREPGNAAGGSAGPLQTSRRFRPLLLAEDPAAATDQLPTMTPGLTASSVEMTMSAIFGALNRQHITTIGLLATDTRDKLFLASQIARSMPSVTLFTVEADLLASHPDYESYVHGMIVGTTYPLFLENQHWLTAAESGLRQRRQFPTTNTEGLYNAVLALLNYDKDGSPLKGRVAPPLLDYEPFASSRRRDPHASSTAVDVVRPSAWVLVTGRDGLWPLGQMPVDDAYVQPIQRPHVDSAGVALVVPSIWMRIGFVLLLAVGLGHVAAFGLGRVRVRRPAVRDGLFRAAELATRRWPLFRLFGTSPHGRLYECVLIGALALSHVFAMTFAVLAAGHMSPAPHWLLSAWMVVALGAAITVALVVETVWALGSAIRQGRSRAAAASAAHLALVSVVAAVLMVFACVALYGLTQYLPDYWRRPFSFVHFFERTTHPGNGVSALPATALLVAAIYLWALTNLQQLAAPRLDSLLDATWLDASWLAPLRHVIGFLRAPIWGLRAKSLAFVLLVAVGTAVLVGSLGLVTTERWEYTRFFAWAWVLVQCLVCLSVMQALYLWSRLRELLGILAHARMAGAFSRLPRTILHGLSGASPVAADLRVLLDHVRSLALSVPAATVPAASAPAGAGAGPAGAIEADLPMRDAATPNPIEARLGLTTVQLQQLRADLLAAAPLEGGAESHQPWSESGTWRWLLTRTAPLVKVLDHVWSTEARRSFLHPGPDAEIDDELQQWCLRVEELVAMEMTLVVQGVLAHLVHRLFAVAAMLILMVLAQSSLAIEPRQPLLAVAWVYVIFGVFVASRIVVQVEHDRVLSECAGTEPGQISWNSSFIGRTFTVALVPLLTLFTAQFPQIADSITHWFTQVQPLP